ncbi:MAG TPA: M48 family metalloprotease [Candidatus Angelobacter sp.]
MSAQILGIGKKKEDKPKVSDKAPEYSDSDKQKIAEILQRPDIQAEIEAEWETQRSYDLEYAYQVNSSSNIRDLWNPQYAKLREDYGTLYDNPILQRYVNRIGQRLVPKDSPNVYSFKLLLDPVPRAEVLTTGTVYISTGLVALLDNEAQLSYVLAHEIAHQEKGHRYNTIKNAIAERELNVEKEKSAEKRRNIIGAIGAGVGAAFGGGFGGGRGAMLGALIGGAGGYGAWLLLIRSKTTATEWSTLYENEADETGFKYMLDQDYDVREIPHLYANLQNMVTKDERMSLGFVGKRSRITERIATVQGLLNGAYKASIDAKLKGSGLKGSSPDFPVLMEALKRDNGIIAMDYDLFAVARDNLEEAVNLRSNDARAQSYLGKVIALTGRTPDDQQQAMLHFAKALQYDAARGAYPDPHLERALFLIAQNNSTDQEEIRKELQTYVALFQREHAGQLPGNMPILYDYFALEGDTTWYVPPAAEVSTRFADPLNVNSSGNATAPTVQQVVDKATANHAPATRTINNPEPGRQPVGPKKVATPKSPR